MMNFPQDPPSSELLGLHRLAQAAYEASLKLDSDYLNQQVDVTWDAFLDQCSMENICEYCLVPQFAPNGDANCPCQKSLDLEREVRGG